MTVELLKTPDTETPTWLVRMDMDSIRTTAILIGIIANIYNDNHDAYMKAYYSFFGQDGPEGLAKQIGNNANQIYPVIINNIHTHFEKYKETTEPPICMKFSLFDAQAMIVSVASELYKVDREQFGVAFQDTWKEPWPESEVDEIGKVAIWMAKEMMVSILKAQDIMKPHSNN